MDIQNIDSRSGPRNISALVWSTDMLRLVFGMTVLLSGCVAEPDESVWPPGPLRTHYLVSLQSDQFDPNACAGGHLDVFTAEMAGRRVTVPLTHFISAFASRVNRDRSARVFNVSSEGPDGCPGAPFPAVKLHIKLAPKTPLDEQGNPSPLLELQRYEAASTGFNLWRDHIAERRAKGRCRKPNPSVTVCETTLNDADVIRNSVLEGVLIFAEKIPPFSTGDPFVISCNSTMSSCKITDWLSEDTYFSMGYAPRITTNRQAANLWVKLRPVVEYYARGGGSKPPVIR
ncbi:MAG: hypothetical protein AAFP68_14970 [Pseudomonadota bacterium]